MKLIAVLVAAAAGAVLLFLLTSATANTDLFASHYVSLMAANIGLAAVLVILVAIQLVRLWREYRQKQFGSRLKSRLLWMLALMAVLPGMLVYGVSLQFAVRSIDSWFDVRVDSALEGGLELGRSVLAGLQSDLRGKARSMALDLSDGSTGVLRLTRLREQAGVESATLISGNGQVLAYSNASGTGALMPPMPNSSQLRQARASRSLGWVEGDAASGLNLHALTTVVSGLDGEHYLLLVQPVPADIARNAEIVESAFRDYQTLQIGRGSLKRVYTLTLTLTLLMGLFGAVMLAFFLAKRLARPLLILAEGTQAVAAGDFTPRAALESNDEMGILTRSFNQMTAQLSDARRETDRHRGALEAARAYLESVLANLSAGVLAFDRRFHLRAANHGAVTILADELAHFEDMALTDWPRQQVLASAIAAGFAELGAEWSRELELNGPLGEQKTLLVRGSTLPTGDGYVVVFDDISQLISAQRSAAWGEVARRLAHEIKNPLTPIQLSAERLQIKLADRLQGADRDMLERCTRTIVNQVGAMKNMVNEFRDYARLPPPVLTAVDLKPLIDDTLALYESSRAPVKVVMDEPLPPVLADSNQLRQVIHNLVTNAQDALTDVAIPQVTVRIQQDGRRVVIRVADNGPGFAPATLARAFEPYVTTKAKGTGLGLAIVRKIVEEHHGEVRLANRDEGGAEITLRLPVAIAVDATASGEVTPGLDAPPEPQPLSLSH